MSDSVVVIPPDECMDANEMMFHACFAVLGHYVEKNLGIARPREAMYRGYRFDACDSSDQRAIDLWIWYCDELPMLTKKFYERMRKYPIDFLDRLKDEKFHELINMRYMLWT